MLLRCGRSLREGVVGGGGAGGDRTSQWIGLSVRQVKTMGMGKGLSCKNQIEDSMDKHSGTQKQVLR